ncbi:MAG: hypothetical protein JWN61_150, partial [Pseudonocardiales bacterium]|nr:hypothetical protein [Pseudonocardiales bacterium]
SGSGAVSPAPGAAVPANGLVAPYEPAVPLAGYVEVPVPASGLAGPGLGGADLSGDEWAAPGRVPTAGTAL